MSHRKQRVDYRLDTKDTDTLPDMDIRAILRGADEIIDKGGRSLLAKILKGSRAQEISKFNLDQCPVYGHYRQLSLADVLARVDWTIMNGYLKVIYEGRLPVLIFTEMGWEIEKETFVNELLDGFDKLLATSQPPYDMTYLKDRNRGLIWLLLDKLEEIRDPKYLPVLKAWEQIDYKRVSQRIRQVISKIKAVS
jgi:hypothetical protein